MFGRNKPELVVPGSIAEFRTDRETVREIWIGVGRCGIRSRVCFAFTPAELENALTKDFAYYPDYNFVAYRIPVQAEEFQVEHPGRARIVR